MSIGRLLAISILLGAGVHAQVPPQLTTIQDTLFKADGTRMNATAVISWTSFQSPNGPNVGTQTATVKIVNGNLYVQLVPNTTATPAYPYTVTYSSDGMIQFQETWMVPPSTTPLHVRDVRTSSTTNVIQTGGPVSGQINSGGVTSQVTETSVTGLIADLASRPLKGTGYGTSRVAMVDGNGALNTVIGNAGDCVYVNGTSGPCFDPTQLPTYGDSETPAGIVDGSNTSFALAGTPTPPQSMVLFRNGMAQKIGLDYTVTGSVLQFNAGAGPQPGDTLLTFYRKPSTAALTGQSGNIGTPGSTLSTLSPQVICSSPGTQTGAVTTTTLGTCTIPANTLGPGDRVEMRFLLSHTGGTTSAFNYAVNWGAAAVLQRSALSTDSAISGRSDAAITAGASQFAGESFGSASALLPVLSSLTTSNTSALTISFTGSMSTSGSESLALTNFTVIRYPAITNP